MALYRFTMIFDQAPYGWTETYFATSTTPEQAVRLAGGLAPVRMALCPQAVGLLGVRVSNDAVRGDASLANTSTDSSIPSFGTNGNNPAAESEVAYMVRLETQAPEPTPTPLRANSRRILLLRGLPEAVMDGNRLEANPGAIAQRWYGNLAAFLQFLRNPSGTGFGPWQLRQQKLFAINPANNKILEIIPDSVNPQYMSVTTVGGVTAEAGFLAVGDKVLISGVTGSTGVNGLWIVSAVPTGAPWTYRLGPHRKLAAIRTTPLFGPSGYMNSVSWIGADIIRTVDLHRNSSRETGRPFGVPVGRRKTR